MKGAPGQSLETQPNILLCVHCKPGALQEPALKPGLANPHFVSQSTEEDTFRAAMCLPSSL